MKTMPILFLILSAWLLPAVHAQTRDSSAVRQNRNRVQTQGQKEPGQQGFRDENGNGIDDRIEVRGTGKGMKSKDRFIDADGDGICDGRAGGLGFRRGTGTGAGATGGKGTAGGKRLGQGGKK